MADKLAEETVMEELRHAQPDWGFLMEEASEAQGAPGKPR
jgi:myo-inositol-1(or 4)-monophosphatase